MIGIWHSYSDVYLFIVGAAMLLAFGIPLLVVPVHWAHLFRWQVSQPDHLIVFLARSMGIVVSLVALFAFRVTAIPAAKPFFFDFMLALLGAMLVLHVYGAIRKTQPFTETVEISLWVVLFLVTLCFYPA
jgi:uncharacterized membrane protein YeaQ/YmgE (transglycosylase-associated protein family)